MRTLCIAISAMILSTGAALATQSSVPFIDADDVHAEGITGYGVEGAPAYILIGKNGKILLSRESNWGEIAAAANKARAKN